jgi:hypothetical protein
LNTAEDLVLFGSHRLVAGSVVQEIKRGGMPHPFVQHLVHPKDPVFGSEVV